VSVQSRELCSLQLVEPFYLESSVLLPRYEGETLSIARRSRRAFIKPILDSAAGKLLGRAGRACHLSQPSGWCAEIERLDLQPLPPNSRGLCIRGRRPARATGHRAVYADLQCCSELAEVLEKLGLGRLSPSFHGTVRNRLVLPSSISSLQDLARSSRPRYAPTAGCLPTAGSPTRPESVLRPGRCGDAAASAAVQDADRHSRRAASDLRRPVAGRLQRCLLSQRSLYANCASILASRTSSAELRVPERVFRARVSSRLPSSQPHSVRTQVFLPRSR